MIALIRRNAGKRGKSEAKLNTKSVYVDVREGATFNSPALADIDELRMNGEFLGHAITTIDNIGCVVLSDKDRDGFRIRRCRKSKFANGQLAGEVFFVASKGDTNAHGQTIRESLQELAFKSGDRDISKYRNLDPQTENTLTEWVFIYRMVTGACQYGTKLFLKGKKLKKKKYTLAEVLVETREAWGAETFRTFVGGNM